MQTVEAAPLEQPDIDRVIAPFGQSFTLPGKAYTSQAVFDWEMDHFYDRAWVCHGRTTEPQVKEDPSAGLEDWHGFAMLNRSGDAKPLAAYFRDLEPLIAPYRMEKLVSARRLEYTVGANWKLLVENYHECYHCPQIHPELCRVTPPTSGDNYRTLGLWVGGSMDLEEHAQTMSLTGESKGEYLPLLDDFQRRHVYYFGLFPNLLLSPHPDYVLTHVLKPIAPDRTLVVCDCLFEPSVLERAGFDPSYATDFWDITNRQDWTACESVQRGVSSRAYRPGPVSRPEDAVYQFLSIIGQGYLTGEVCPPINPDKS
jgi:Rieske 2Fe-2S family protein